VVVVVVVGAGVVVMEVVVVEVGASDEVEVTTWMTEVKTTSNTRHLVLRL